MQAAALFASTGLAIWAAVIARTRRGVPGGTAFGWMMLAIAWWSFTSALHTLIDDFETRIVIAKLQYLGVAPIGVLWLLFATDYSRVGWPAHRITRALVWIVPVVTLVLVATNEQHQLHWRAIDEVMTPLGRRLVYHGGSWYWVHVSYTYLLILIGTATLARGLGRFPLPSIESVVSSTCHIAPEGYTLRAVDETEHAGESTLLRPARSRKLSAPGDVTTRAPAGAAVS